MEHSKISSTEGREDQRDCEADAHVEIEVEVKYEEVEVVVLVDVTMEDVISVLDITDVQV